VYKHEVAARVGIPGVDRDVGGAGLQDAKQSDVEIRRPFEVDPDPDPPA
jgi:hypothetical protein